MGKRIIRSVHHEVCTCGHCRCNHVGTFEACRLCKPCFRYTWPGPGSDLPSDHAGSQGAR